MTPRKPKEDLPELFDLGDLDGFSVPAAVYVTYDDVKNERIIVKEAEMGYGDFGEYYKLTLNRYNSETDLFMNVGASQPVEQIDKAVEQGKLPFKAKFVRQGRTWLLVGWNYVQKR